MNVDDLAPLARTTRNGFDESIHHGCAVVVDHDGAVVAAVGHPDALIYPRSALKPLQLMAMLDAGLASLELADEQLAVAAASHVGTPLHVAAVEALLIAAGLDEAVLANTPDWPLDTAARRDVVRAGGTPTPLLHNCSGKHAAMVATCGLNGWDRDGYLSVDHPLQQAIRRVIDERAGGVVHVGIDGCGAPTMATSLRGIAGAFGRLAADASPVATAMAAHPVLVGGVGRDDTILMEAVPGLIAKGGAEGVLVVGHRDGWSAAVKVADGNPRALLPVTIALLADRLVDADLSPAPILGHGHPVGTVEAVIY